MPIIARERITWEWEVAGFNGAQQATAWAQFIPDSLPLATPPLTPINGATSFTHLAIRRPDGTQLDRRETADGPVSLAGEVFIEIPDALISHGSFITTP